MNLSLVNSFCQAHPLIVATAGVAVIASRAWIHTFARRSSHQWAGPQAVSEECGKKADSCHLSAAGDSATTTGTARNFIISSTHWKMHQQCPPASPHGEAIDAHPSGEVSRLAPPEMSSPCYRSTAYRLLQEEQEEHATFIVALIALSSVLMVLGVIAFLVF